MNRRTVLTATGLALTTSLAGCTGSSSPPDNYTQAVNHNEIGKQASELVLTRDQFGAGWSNVPRPRETETEFEQQEDGNLHVVNSRVWVYGTVKEAQDKYSARVSQIDVAISSVEMAAEAVQFTVSSKVEILFRDANTVGRLRYEYAGSQTPNPERAMTYAEKLYENFR